MSTHIVPNTGKHGYNESYIWYLEVGLMSQIKYYFMNHTLVDPDVAMKHREIISENVTNAPGDMKLFTLTFKQVLQDFSVRNWNGRVYRPDIVVNALDKNPRVQHDIRMKTWTGEYG